MNRPWAPKPWRRRLRIAGTAALVAALAACSSSDRKMAEDARRTAGSWGATVSAAAERWNSDQISTRFFQSVVTEARIVLHREAQTARKSGGESAAAPVEAVATHVDAVASALARGDRRAAIEAAHAAASSASALKTPLVARPR
jgi:hypothetical protein